MTKKLLSILSGLTFVCIALIIFGVVFLPVIIAEIKYSLQIFHKDSFTRKNLEFPVTNLNKEEFRIIIPKININSQVLSNIDPYNKEAYLSALSQGVAQARGSALPGENGNIFIFAHSTNSPTNISNYNALFYLVNKLIKGDAIYLTYQGKNYKYTVTETKIVNSSEVRYLYTQDKSQSLTLMTCWPPGTTLKRLLITSRLAT